MTLLKSLIEGNRLGSAFSALIEPKESKHFSTWNGASLVDIIVEFLVKIILLAISTKSKNFNYLGRYPKASMYLFFLFVIRSIKLVCHIFMTFRH